MSTDGECCVCGLQGPRDGRDMALWAMCSFCLDQGGAVSLLMFCQLTRTIAIGPTTENATMGGLVQPVIIATTARTVATVAPASRRLQHQQVPGESTLCIIGHSEKVSCLTPPPFCALRNIRWVPNDAQVVLPHGTFRQDLILKKSSSMNGNVQEIGEKLKENKENSIRTIWYCLADLIPRCNVLMKQGR